MPCNKVGYLSLGKRLSEAGIRNLLIHLQHLKLKSTNLGFSKRQSGNVKARLINAKSSS